MFQNQESNKPDSKQKKIRRIFRQKRSERQPTRLKFHPEKDRSVDKLGEGSSPRHRDVECPADTTAGDNLPPSSSTQAPASASSPATAVNDLVVNFKVDTKGNPQAFFYFSPAAEIRKAGFAACAAWDRESA
jgi:hypothetical protein